MTGRPPRPWGDAFFHVAEGVPYYVENSYVGIARAYRRRLAKRRKPYHYGIDLDCQVTRDGVVVATHWGTPLRHGFTDPTGELAADTPIGSMTWAEVRRLRARYHGRTYRIRTAVDLTGRALKRGLGVELELKSDAFAHRPRVVAAFVAGIQALPGYQRGRVWAKTLTDIPHKPGGRLKVFRDHGIPTLLLARGDKPLPKAWRPGAGMVDDVRGRVAGWRS